MGKKGPVLLRPQEPVLPVQRLRGPLRGRVVLGDGWVLGRQRRQAWRPDPPSPLGKDPGLLPGWLGTVWLRGSGVALGTGALDLAA